MTGLDDLVVDIELVPCTSIHSFFDTLLCDEMEDLDSLCLANMVSMILSLKISIGILSYPIHSCFSSKVPDVRSNQIRSTDLYWIHCDKLLHSYPIHITLNTAYFLHLVYLPFRYIGYAYFRLCFTDPFHLWLTSGLCLTSNKRCLYIAILCA